MLSRREIQEINDAITLESAKIYYKFSSGYTSKLWQSLVKLGYRSFKRNKRTMITDSTGKIVIVNNNWLGALRQLEKLPVTFIKNEEDQIEEE